MPWPAEYHSKAQEFRQKKNSHKSLGATVAAAVVAAVPRRRQKTFIIIYFQLS